MLEKASAEKIAKLRRMPGKEVTAVAIATIESGIVIRVTTVSGNQYLFEVTDPAAHRAYVVRYDSSGIGTFGYLGQQIISPVFHVKRKIVHGLACTLAVAGITILQKEVE